jgi:palmitoyltransferase
MYENYGSVTDRISVLCVSSREVILASFRAVHLLACRAFRLNSTTNTKASAEVLFTAITTWPPHNPAHSSDNPDGALTLPHSPWTYDNGTVNPTLEPSNTRLRQQKKHKRQVQDQDFGKSPLPPYHPDYDANAMDASEDSDSASEVSDHTTPFVRGGSEGYEVQSVDREDMLKRYLKDIGQEPGRYHRYIPSPDSDSDEELPLAQVLKDN